MRSDSDKSSPQGSSRVSYNKGVAFTGSMTTKNRRVATYLPPDLERRFKKYLDKHSGLSESACLLKLLDLALPPVNKAVGSTAIERIESLERSVLALQSEVQKINDF